MTAAAPIGLNGTSTRHVLPQLRLKRPPQARGVLSPPRATQQPQQLPRLSRLSDAAAEFPFVRLVKMFLYFWTVMAIILGVVLACLVLYLMFFKDGGNLAPSLPFNLAAYGGLATTFGSCFGLYGLLHHRKLVTEGRRNYSLGIYIFLGTIGAIVVVLAGAMALSLVHIVVLAQEEEFSSNRVVALETQIITNLHAQVSKSSSAWRDTQSEFKCCGYDQVSVIQGYLSPSGSWESLIQDAVEDVNAVGGRYCSSRVSECMRTMSETHCPVPGRDWCRVKLLNVAYDNYSLLSTCAITLGAVQLLFSAFGLFTLLCDVRRIRNLSPIYDIQHQILSPIQPISPNA